MMKNGYSNNRSKNQRMNRMGMNDFRNNRPQQQLSRPAASNGYQRQSRFSNAPSPQAYHSRQSTLAIAGQMNGTTAAAEKRPLAYQTQNNIRYENNDAGNDYKAKSSTAYAHPPLPKQPYQSYHTNGYAAIPAAIYATPPPMVQFNFPPPVAPVKN